MGYLLLSFYSAQLIGPEILVIMPDSNHNFFENLTFNDLW